MLDSFRSTRPSTKTVHDQTHSQASNSLRDDKGKYIINNSLRDEKGKFIKNSSPALSLNGTREQRHARSTLAVKRDPARVPKRRLDTDHHGRSLMPPLKRHAAHVASPGASSSAAAEKKHQDDRGCESDTSATKDTAGSKRDTTEGIACTGGIGLCALLPCALVPAPLPMALED